MQLADFFNLKKNNSLEYNLHILQKECGCWRSAFDVKPDNPECHDRENGKITRIHNDLESMAWGQSLSIFIARYMIFWVDLVS